MSDLGGFSLFELFRGEAEQHAATLSADLVKLEQSASPADIEPLMRAAHSIKGAAKVIGLDRAVDLAHAMEDALVAMQQGREIPTAERIDQLLRATDLLASLAAISESELAAWTAANTPVVAALAASLLQPIARGAVAAPTTQRSLSAPLAVPKPEPRERTSAVRVTAEKLDRLLQLAGETMLESRRLEVVRRQSQSMKSRVIELEDELDRLRTWMRQNGIDANVLAPLRKITSRTRNEVVGHIASVDESIRRGEETATSLYHEVLSSRMRPFADVTGALPRTVRDIARQLGKEVRLEVIGESVQVDRDILARLEAPLNHLLRNALDHGLEMPDERRAAGKSESSLLRVEALHHAGMLRIRVSDDGRGIHSEMIRESVVRKALASSEMVAEMSNQEVLEFLFLPGFSTAAQVTDLSGRGVGLDVVQSTMREVGGRVRVESAPGTGTVFELELPITVSVIRALLAEVSGETFAFPLARIERVVQLHSDALTTVEGRLQFSLDDRSVGLVDAATLFELGAIEVRDSVSVVVLGGDDWYGFLVDKFVGEEDLVVRTLDSRLGKVAHVSAAAIREDGDPALIVDCEDILSSMRQQLTEGRPSASKRRAIAASSSVRRKRVLVVDDSATVREVERQLLVRLGYEVDTANDGADGFHALRDGGYDLLVSDVDMPRMTGIELTRAVRLEPTLTRLPIIIVSYKDREEDRLAGMNAGANAYLTKGAFQDQTFAATVRDLIGEAEQ
ncbi:MAG: hybrid sensor histidine kinase/response regulator [Phycisphaerales bacterium]|nr:hybrid sensor histidine kinase/response regulator [Phycisphaerales bacterium]